MNQISKYDENFPPEQELVEFESVSSGSQSQGQFDIADFILRRWWIVVLSVIPIYAVGIPLILFVFPKQYDTEGAIEIAPVVTAILYQDQETQRPLPNYDSFKNTQAAIMKSDRVLSRTANDLKDRNLIIFKDSDNLLLTIRKAVNDNSIQILPDRHTNLVRISMSSSEPGEAEIIINSILQNYMDIVLEDEIQGGNKKLGILQDERKQLEEKLERQKEAVRLLVKEYGTDELEDRQDLEFENLAELRRELSTIEIRQMALESQIKSLEGNIAPSTTEATDWINLRNQIVNSDPFLTSLRQDISRYEELVEVGKRTLADTNPEFRQRQQLLATLRERYEERSKEVLTELEESLKKEQERTRQQKAKELKSELEYVVSYQKVLQEKIGNLDTKTIELGNKQFTINDQQEQIATTKQRLQEINLRMEQLSLESKRPARISIAFEPSSVPASGKRKKMAAAVGFMGLAFGGSIALLIHLMDKRLHRPQEVVKRIGVRILGTTTNPSSVNRNLLAQQLSDDYQTIRANLSLLNGKGDSQIILVTSPGVRDGKTTFSINLATSFAQAGRNTLLIDGDLRKPDVAVGLGLSMELRGLQDYLFGKDLNLCVYKLDGLSLSLLAADFRNASDALNLIAHPHTAKRIRTLKESYDVIVIDSPPVLAFADSLVWSKMADSVILTSFLGHTSQEEIREAVKRLEEIGANIVGTVVNNVKIEHGYRHYGYGYGYSDQRKSDKSKKQKGRDRTDSLLLTRSSDEGEMASG